MMLCKQIESGREKCAFYWKEKNDKNDKYSIKVVDEKNKGDY